MIDLVFGCSTVKTGWVRAGPFLDGTGFLNPGPLVPGSRSQIMVLTTGHLKVQLKKKIYLPAFARN